MRLKQVLFFLGVCFVVFSAADSYAEVICKKDAKTISATIFTRTGDTIWYEVSVGGSTGKIGIDINEIARIANDDGTVSVYSPTYEAEMKALEEKRKKEQQDRMRKEAEEKARLEEEQKKALEEAQEPVDTEQAQRKPPAPQAKKPAAAKPPVETPGLSVKGNEAVLVAAAIAAVLGLFVMNKTMKKKKGA